MAEPVFLRRRLAAANAGPLRCLDALRWDTPLGSGLRLYFGTGADAAALDSARATDMRLTQTARIGGGLLVKASAGAGRGAIDLPLAGGEVPLDTGTPEAALFDDLNVVVALRHGETADQIAAWLAYHVAEHDAQGLLLFDRAAPGGASDAFARELRNATAAITGLRRLLLLDAPLPLGRDGAPALGDPATAPRARNREASADPWCAPLAEPLIFDILKWRFLSRAGAVLALDPCDLLDPPADGIAIFAACRQSHTGLIPVLGEASYPWRMKKGRAPAFGDHICRARPAIAAPRRWCVAPKRCDPDALWLPNQIAGLAAIADETASYSRCMSLLFPQSGVAELVDKTQLTADPALLARATGTFAHDPVRPPKPAKPKPVLPTIPATTRTAIVTCMKNEGPFILEWLAYHRMIGIDDFLIYTNDCDDGTDRLLDLLEAQGLLQRRDNPFRETGTKPQHAALAAARAEPVVQNAGWLISMDVDEYLNIHVGQGHLADLYAAVPEADLISLTWRLFGNSDLDAYEDRFVTEQFIRCAPQLIRRPHQAWGFKTLFRNSGLFKTFGVHRPKGFVGEAAQWVNGSGAPMPPDMLKTGWRSRIDTYGYDLVTLNHYSVRNAESFLVKRDRGRVNHVMRDQGAAYWFRMNNNDETDFSIQRHRASLRKAVDALMADAEIAAAHAGCVAAHRARIAALRADAGYAALYAQLCSDRMKRLSRMHHHFGMNVFLHGPSVVPDRVFEPDLPHDFFFNTAPPAGKPAE